MELPNSNARLFITDKELENFIEGKNRKWFWNGFGLGFVAGMIATILFLALRLYSVLF